MNHRRRILSTTFGHPARWNDKTVQLFDEFLSGMYKEGSMDHAEFFLYEYNDDDWDDESSFSPVAYEGMWVQVDYGYLHWPTTIPPFKNYTTYKEKRWSNWLESMWKDVECTFGILKGRFRISKTGIRLHGVEAVNKIWKTCCALHNMLLDVDGLEEGWEEGQVTVAEP